MKSKVIRLGYDKLKLLLLLLMLSAPVPVAWSMWYWQVGIPQLRASEGELLPEIDNINEWPLIKPIVRTGGDHWYLVFRCKPLVPDCQLRDDLWRMHRALGRDARRLERWYLLSENSHDPIAGKIRGEQVALLYQAITLDDLGQDMIWLADPEGNVVLSYGHSSSIRGIFQDIRYLLKRNPAPPQWQAQARLQTGSLGN